MKSIALPERKILLPRLEFPAWLRFPRGVSDERVARMLAPLGGMLTPLGVSGIAANVLASVPWVAQWKFNNTGNDSIGSNNLTNNNSATFTTGKLGGATGAVTLVLKPNLTKQLAAMDGLRYDVQMVASGAVTTLTEGDAEVVADVTRAVA